MATVDITQLTALDIPPNWPEPLRRSLLDLYGQLTTLVDELNLAIESANSANETGADNSSQIEGQSQLISDLNIATKSNNDAVNSNAKQIGIVDRKISDSNEDIDFIKNDYVSKSKLPIQSLASAINLTGNLSVDGEIVVIATQQGWLDGTGTLKLGGMNSSTSYVVGAAYDQTEVQAIAAGLVEVREVVNALSSALYNHHQLIGATVIPPP